MSRPPTPERLAWLIDRFVGRRVTLLGDLVVDEFVHGDIERVSREAPVLILAYQHTATVPGGAGNAAANLRALGADPQPVGVLGRDPSGEAIVDWFRSVGISTAGIVRRAAYQTPTKMRIIAGGVHTRRQQIVRVDRGRRPGDLPRELREAVRRKLRSSAARSEGLLIADYGFGAADPSMLRAAYPRGAPRSVTVDSRGRVDRFRGATASTPNQEEVERILGCGPLITDRDIERAGRRLLRRCGNAAVVITRGARGMSLIRRGSSVEHIPAYGSDEVADVTGAGDTVIAVLTLGLLAGGSIAEAAHLANYAAGLVVMKAGTATIARDELLDAVRHES